MNWMAVLGMATASFSFVVAMALMLAPRDERRAVLVLVILGLVASALKIWIFQQAPQWHDINPDSITYDLNARAFAAHWAGHAVEGLSHQLKGLMAFNVAGHHGPEWAPEDSLTYAWVIGSHEWLYTSYIALWYFLSDATQGIVIASNALWAAFLPAAAFGIAINLGAAWRVALVAASLALIDPYAGVNASWLLKDTLAGFLAMMSLWAFLGYIRSGARARLLIAALALGLLGGVRFVSFLGLVIAAGIVCIWLLVQKQRLQALAIAGVLSCAWLLQGALAQAPHFYTNSVSSTILSTPLRTFTQGVGVLEASKGERSADETVISWKQALSSRPFFAIARSLARTLFAPYPWVAVYPGLNWSSFAELYYPGVLLWIICLPGVITATLLGLRRRDPVFWLLLLFIASQIAAYTIWQGEWSTRQRVFALPALFAMAAVGWVQLCEVARRLRVTRSAHSTATQ